MPLVEKLPYTPWSERGAVVDGAFRWRLGVRPLDLRDWIELGPDAEGPDGWIAEKERVLAEHHDTAFAVLDGIESAGQEVGVALVDHLRQRWPDRFGDVVLDGSRHPLEAAGRLVPEDLVVMVERNGRLVFGGGCVCFPNRWDLRSKLGGSMAEVHQPVAGLNDQLEHGVDGFLERLRPERSFWRLGWGIIDLAGGYAPVDGTGEPRPVDPDVSALFVRVERETLRRFAESGCVLFTIRTYVAPITSVMVDEDSARALVDAVGAMSPDVLGYKDLTAHADAIARARASGGGSGIRRG